MQSEKARAAEIGSPHSTEAIHELLRRPPRGLVQLCDAVQQTKLRAELAVQVFGVIADDIQSAALLRPIQAECGDDDVTAQPNCAGDLTHIRGSVVCTCQEMEDRPVVPEIVASGLQLD